MKLSILVPAFNEEKLASSTFLVGINNMVFGGPAPAGCGEGGDGGAVAPGDDDQPAAGLSAERASR
jgi:hypothetical protein